MGNSIVTKLGGEDHQFEFNLNEIEELQRQCGDTGIGVIIERTLRNEFFISDIYHTIRLGLIGGGCNAVKAKELSELNVIGRPLANPDDPSSPLSVAKVILANILMGVAEPSKDPKGQAATEGEKAGSMSPQSEQQPSKPEETQSR